MTIHSGFSHEKWWFSIAMLNYQRVFSIHFPRRFSGPLVTTSAAGSAADGWTLGGAVAAAGAQGVSLRQTMIYWEQMDG